MHLAFIIHTLPNITNVIVPHNFTENIKKLQNKTVDSTEPAASTKKFSVINTGEKYTERHLKWIRFFRNNIYNRKQSLF